MKKKVSDILVVSFALFAMYFGAGNLIFPPTLGSVAGTQWMLGFGGFLLSEVGLTICGLLAITLTDGNADKFSEGLPHWAVVVFFSAISLIIGPLYAIPRTAATTFEIAIMPVAVRSFVEGGSAALTEGATELAGGGTAVFITGVITKLIFFVITLIFVMTPSNIIDKIGKLLTPFLLIALAFLIFRGIFSPLGEITTGPTEKNIFEFGLQQGYQTMDALATVLFGVMLVNTMKEKGYASGKPLFRMSLTASIVACLGLALVYGGLTYLGATANSVIPANAGRTERLVELAQKLWGPIGGVILGFSVALACLTTAIGLVAPFVDYFSKLLKVSPKVMAVIAVTVSFLISLKGVDDIIKIAGPILEILYPIMIVLIFMTFFRKILPNFWFKRGAIIGTVIVGFTMAIFSVTKEHVPTGFANFITSLPLYDLGFAWLLPALACSIIAGVIACIAGDKKKALN